MKAVTRSPILDALDADSWQWMSATSPELLDAIEREVADGKTPAQIQRTIAAHVGPERNALATRAYQAARHCARMQRG